MKLKKLYTKMKTSGAVITLLLILIVAVGIVGYGSYTDWTWKLQVTSPGGTSTYVITTDGTTYYMQNGTTGQIDFQSTNASAVTQAALGNMTSGDSLYLKGQLWYDNPIIIDGSSGKQLYHAQLSVKFDIITFELGAGGLVLNNLDRGIEIEGGTLTTEGNSATQSLLTLQGAIQNSLIKIDNLYGDWASGNAVGINYTGENGAYLANNQVTVVNPYSLKHVLYVNLTGNAYASINHFNLGWFEGHSPQQILIYAGGTNAFRQNVIAGSGGAISSWNPQSLTELYVIKLQTSGSGHIYGTAFDDFWIYNAENSSYIADKGVIGTRFVGGMPRPELTSYWHDGGSGTLLLATYQPDTGYNTGITADEASASYIVYTDGINYYMRNGTTGIVDFSSTNASQVSNAAEGNASLVHGSVLWKAGIYVMTNPVILKNNTVNRGEGWGTVFRLADNRPYSNPATDWPLHEVFTSYNGGAAGTLANCTVSDMTIDGNKANQATVNAGDHGQANVHIYGGANNVILSDLNVLDGKMVNIDFDGWGNIVNCHVLRCLALNADWDDIDMYGFSPPYETRQCSIEQCTVGGDSGDIGIGLGGSGGIHSISILNNVVLPMSGMHGSTRSNPTWYSIAIGGYASSCLVEGNNIENYDGISVQPGCNNNMVMANTLNMLNRTDGGQDYGIFIEGNNNTVQGNAVYAHGNLTLAIACNGGDNTIIGNVFRSDFLTQSHVVDHAANTYIDNDMRYCSSARELWWNGVANRPFNGSVTVGNLGYNPVGVIANPILGTWLCDYGSGTIANNTLYTCSDSPKNVYVSGGTVSSVQVDGTVVFTATGCMVDVEPGDTFKIVWSSPPTIVVIGQ